MARLAYMSIIGEKQGKIRGSATTIGREDCLIILNSEHHVVSAPHEASGHPIGERQHNPLIVTLFVDRATPLLYRAFATNETLSKVQITYWQALKTGKEANVYTVELENAFISSLRFIQPDAKNPETMDRKEILEVAFVYLKIFWTWMDGEITADDFWPQESKRRRL
jgi:type VI secretion system secreted protein Hcp